MTSNADAIAGLFGPLDTLGANLPPLTEIFPDYPAPVIVAGRGIDGGGLRKLETMRWGWPPFGEVRRPITNVRNLASPMWRAALADPARRCLVPATAFAEWSAAPDPATGRKRKHWFALREAGLFAFAGLWRPTPEGPRFAFLTCAPNRTVGRIHPKAMPVILDRPAEADRWLAASGEQAAAMQRALADEAMEEIGMGDPEPGPLP